MLNYKKIQDLQIKLEKAQQRLNNKLEKFEELKKDGKLMQKKFKDYRTNGKGWEDTSDEDLKKAIIRNFQIFDVDQAESYVNELERKLERLMKTWKEEEPQRLAKEAKDNEKVKAVKNFVYSKGAYSTISKLIEEEKPDIAILNNIHRQLTT